MGWQRSKYCVIGGCLLSLSLCRRGFQDLLKVRPSSLLMLCGCISSSIASLTSPSMYPVLAERSFVSCSLIKCSWLMLCSATADLSGCYSLICLLCSSIRSWMERPLCPIQTLPLSHGMLFIRGVLNPNSPGIYNIPCECGSR
jgi:hypothetical protein